MKHIKTNTMDVLTLQREIHHRSIASREKGYSTDLLVWVEQYVNRGRIPLKSASFGGPRPNQPIKNSFNFNALFFA